jgi:glycosyltransferase involved in cell wall biosynthesis
LALLSETRLLFVAPTPRTSGVGDYAAEFASELKSHFREVIEFWISDRAETVSDVARNLRTIRETAAQAAAQGPVIAHFEQSAGSLTAFWAAMLTRSVPVTATIHDAPQPVWWPFDTSTIKRHRALHHGIHYPLRFLIDALQRRMCTGRVLFSLTSMGAYNLALRYPGSDARDARLLISTRPALKPLTARPSAVGLFGHLYRGKGFDHIDRLRAELDDDIEIVVAGRGTDVLPARRGVRVLGEVNGADEDRFFDSIRLLVVPYTRDSLYGPAYFASSAVSRSFAYGTPILCTRNGALPEIAAEGGAMIVDGIADIARCANTVAHDEATLRALADEVSRLQAERTAARCVAPFVDAWAEIAEAWTKLAPAAPRTPDEYR